MVWGLDWAPAEKWKIIEYKNNKLHMHNKKKTGNGEEVPLEKPVSYALGEV